MPSLKAKDSDALAVDVDVVVTAAPAPSEKMPDWEVHLDVHESPKHMSSARKWSQVFIICFGSACVTCFSSLAGFAEAGIQRDFGVSHTVAILSISLFVAGTGSGPLLLGPLSEFFGRQAVYRFSYSLFVALNFGVAFAPDIATHLVFRFLSGLAGSAFLSVAGGSVADLFDDQHVALPMAVYTTSPFMGPILGPLISGFVNQNLHWRWTYYVGLMWAGVELLMLLLFLPETYEPVLLKWKAARLRKETGDSAYFAPIERMDKSIFAAIRASCTIPFRTSIKLTPPYFPTSLIAASSGILYHERISLLLNIWASLVLGVIYLTLQAFPIIFGRQHHFNVQMTGLSFIGIGIGMCTALATQPFWINLQRRKVIQYNGNPPPETRLYIGMVGAVLFPLGLFWMAFTTYPSVHWAVPMVASSVFGMGTIYIYTTVFTFLVTAYRPYAASALAGNSFLRSIFAAVFPLFAGPMYARLGTVGATALLAGLATLMSPFPFVFYRIGPRLRAHSRFGPR